MTCSIATPIVTISNFQELPENTYVSFTIYGVINPPGAGTFTIELSIQDSLAQKIETKTFSETYTNPEFSPYSIEPIIQPVPNNAQFYSIYYFTFTPNFVIPPNANITVKFPGTYGLLYSNGASNIQCISSGGLEYLQGCVNEQMGSTQTVQMFTLEESTPGKTITLEYHGLVMYPDKIDDLSGFTMTIYIQNLLIASSALISTKITSMIGIYLIKISL